MPLRIVFRREELLRVRSRSSSRRSARARRCRRGEQVAVDLLPEEVGEYEFTCALGMLRGKLVVVPSGQVPA